MYPRACSQRTQVFSEWYGNSGSHSVTARDRSNPYERTVHRIALQNANLVIDATHAQQTRRQVRSSWSAMMSVSYWSMICCGVRPVWWARSLMAVVAQFATDSARAINWSSP